MTTSSGARLKSIDILRGLGALSVLYFHSFLSTWTKIWNDGNRSLAYLPMQGFIGVHLFLVVSGFCIHYRAASRNATANPDFFKFWRRRLRRLYPPYIAAVILTLVCNFCYIALKQWVIKHHIDLSEIPAQFAPQGWLVFGLASFVHLFMLFPLWGGAIGCFGNWVFWSLALEEQLYFMYFLIPYLRRRVGMRGVLAVSAAVTFTWRALSIFGPLAHAQPRMFIDGFVLNHVTLLRGYLPSIAWLDLGPSRWFEWVLGVYAAEITVGRSKAHRVFSSGWLGLGAAALALICQWSALGWVLTDSCWGITFFCLMNTMIRIEKRNATIFSSFGAKSLAGVGAFSYSLYLIHFPLSNLITDLLGRFPYFVARSIATVLVLAVSYLFYIAVERPSIAWSHERA